MRNYAAHTIPDIGDLLGPVEGTIRYKFLPALTGRNATSDLERKLFSLPIHMGGLNIADSTKTAATEQVASARISAPLIALILQQSNSYHHSVTSEQQR